MQYFIIDTIKTNVKNIKCKNNIKNKNKCKNKDKNKYKK